MPLTPLKIKKAVRRVLAAANRRHKRPVFLTAYQVLDQLPEQTKQRLIRDYGMGGEGSKQGLTDKTAAPYVVMRAALLLRPDVELAYLATRTLGLTINKQPVKPSTPDCGIFRLKDREGRRIRPDETTANQVP